MSTRGPIKAVHGLSTFSEGSWSPQESEGSFAGRGFVGLSPSRAGSDWSSSPQSGAAPVRRPGSAHGVRSEVHEAPYRMSPSSDSLLEESDRKRDKKEKKSKKDKKEKKEKKQKKEMARDLEETDSDKEHKTRKEKKEKKGKKEKKTKEPVRQLSDSGASLEEVAKPFAPAPLEASPPEPESQRHAPLDRCNTEEDEMMGARAEVATSFRPAKDSEAEGSTLDSSGVSRILRFLLSFDPPGLTVVWDKQGERRTTAMRVDAEEICEPEGLKQLAARLVRKWEFL
ncbi:unnamed protein product, partial [Effrenium voratum]